MTREQMIDEAVRRFMKPLTMRQVINQAEFAVLFRRTRVPHDWKPEDSGPANGADRWWFEGTIADKGLRRFPGRVRAIRTEFRRIAHEQAVA